MINHALSPEVWYRFDFDFLNLKSLNFGPKILIGNNSVHSSIFLNVTNKMLRHPFLNQSYI